MQQKNISNDEKIKVYQYSSGIMATVMLIMVVHSFITGKIDDAAILLFSVWFSSEELLTFRYTKQIRFLVIGIFMIAIAGLCAFSILDVHI